MAVGDVVSGLSSIGAGASLTIQPAASVEWVIHNVYHASDAEIYFTDGTNSLKFDAHTGLGGWLGVWFHLNNTRYLTVKNTTAGAILIGYDGVQTK